MRQALRFGRTLALAAVAALAWPLIASMVAGSVGATIWIYGIAMAVDVALFGLWCALAIRYSRMAAAGQRFDIPMLQKKRRTRTNANPGDRRTGAFEPKR